MARAPDLAGLDAVGFRGEVAHLFERVAAPAEVVGAVGEALELDGLDLGAVLGALEVAHLLNDAVDGAVDALSLRMKHVDEAPQQALALVRELHAVRGDALDERVHHLLDAGDGLVLVPDETVVDLVRAWGSAVQRRMLADGGGRRCVVPGLRYVGVVGIDAGDGVSGLREGVGHRGLGGLDVLAVGVGHDALLVFVLRGPVPRRDVLSGHARAGEPRGVGGDWRRFGASGAGRRERSERATVAPRRRLAQPAAPERSGGPFGLADGARVTRSGHHDDAAIPPLPKRR